MSTSKGGTDQKEATTGHEVQEGILPTKGGNSKGRCREFLARKHVEKGRKWRKREENGDERVFCEAGKGGDGVSNTRRQLKGNGFAGQV